MIQLIWADTIRSFVGLGHRTFKYGLDPEVSRPITGGRFADLGAEACGLTIAGVPTQLAVNGDEVKQGSGTSLSKVSCFSSLTFILKASGTTIAGEPSAMLYATLLRSNFILLRKPGLFSL